MFSEFSITIIWCNSTLLKNHMLYVSTIQRWIKYALMKPEFRLFKVLKFSSTNVCSLLISIVEFSVLLSRNYYSYLRLIWENYTDFLILFLDDLEQKCHASRQHIKWEYMKVLMTMYFSFLPMELWIWLIAFNYLLALLQMMEICFSKYNLLSISIP